MMRLAEFSRKTAETDISIALNLDGTGKTEINTGLGFLDHLLTNFALHGLFDLRLHAQGDLHVDAHHTVEDVALVLGSAFDRALGERRGIVRMADAFTPHGRGSGACGGRSLRSSVCRHSSRMENDGNRGNTHQPVHPFLRVVCHHGAQ